MMGPRSLVRRLAAWLSTLAILAAPAAQAFPAVDALAGRPPARQMDTLRCTEESRFEPGAISPVGALGIAQFMPGTADLYDLHDPFNPAQAIHKSAWYLRYLTDMFGNIGLAAVAYNGGENRAARFIARNGGLPYETQDYVAAITGFEAVRWRDNPPPASDLKLALNPDMDFRPACEKLAGDRTLREFMTQPKVFPWGVIVASHPNQSGAIQLGGRCIVLRN